ncbi:helix-turn-helix domain-containing protein, partial [Hallerella porci]
SMNETIALSNALQQVLLSWRNQAGSTQDAVARRSHLSRMQLYRLENAKASPSLVLLNRLLSCYHKSWSEFGNDLDAIINSKFAL